MNYDRLHRHALMNRLAKLEQAFRRVIVSFKTKMPGDFIAFFFVETKDHIKVLLEQAYQLERPHNVIAPAFLRLGDRINLCALAEIGENRVQIGITQNSQISDLEAETRQRIGHDRAIATELGQLTYQLDVRAPTSGCAQALRKLLNGWQPSVLLSAFPLVHHVQNFIHKSVQADKRGHLAGAA